MDRVKINDVSTFNGEKWEPKSWPADAEGVGLVEAPRGALAHWIKIHNGAIDNYQLVVPTTWNGSPRDAKQQRSSFEAALIGTPVANLDQPLRSSAPSIPLTRVWPAPCIFTIRRDGTFTRFPSSRPMSTQSTGVRDVFR
jgi:hypothetical protein